MIDCIPESLMRDVSCLRCIPAGMVESIKTSLLCQWANSGEPPEERIHWAPENQQALWADGSGPHTTDFPTFLATADQDTLVTLDFQTPVSTIDTLTGLSTAPMLSSVFTGASNLVSLDASNCLALLNLDVHGSALLTTLTVTNCTALVSLDFQFATSLTSITGLSTCAGNLQNIFGDSCGLTGTLNLDNFTALVFVDVFNSANITDISLTNCISLSSLNCHDCDISDLDASDCSALALLQCWNQVSAMNSLSLSATGLVGALFCYSNNLSAITNLSTCTGMEFLHAGSNPFLSIDVTFSSMWSEIDFSNCPSLSSALLNGTSTVAYWYNFAGCAIPTAGAGGVDDIWSNVRDSSAIVPSSGILMDTSGGTNGPLTGGIANLDYQDLVTFGWVGLAFN